MTARLAAAFVVALSACAAEPVPREEPVGEPARAMRVVLDPAALERAGITVEQVTPRVLTERIRVPAEISTLPDSLVHVTTHVAGHLEEVMATVGDQVEAGEILARLHSVEVGDARAELQYSRARLRTAQAEVDRKRALQRAGIVATRVFQAAQAELEQTQAAHRAATDRLKIYDARDATGGIADVRAPIRGEIIERHATRGEVVHSHDELFVIGELSTVRVIGKVYEEELPRVAMGSDAILTVHAYPRVRWEGVINYASPHLDPRTRTADVYVDLDNSGGELRAGMFGTLHVTVQGGSDPAPVLAVPRGAVQQIDGIDYVFVASDAEGTFIPVAVDLGEETDFWLAIESGLERGERIATSGTFVLRSELLRHRIAGG